MTVSQTTIGQSIRMSGRALHTGVESHLGLEPLPAHGGIQFRRDSGSAVGRPFVLSPQRVGDTRRCTALLGDDGEWIRTVEHLLAAVSLCGLDNILITVDAEELPLGDGSAAQFVELLREAGTVEQGVPAQTRRVDRPTYVAVGDRLVAAFPCDGLRVTCVFTDDQGVLGTQAIDCPVCSDTIDEFCHARTIGFMREIEYLRAQGLALGGELDKAIVIDAAGYVNMARYPDEPVRHKALDLIGDMAGLGRLHAHLLSVRGGHALNNELARLISEMPCA